MAAEATDASANEVDGIRSGSEADRTEGAARATPMARAAAKPTGRKAQRERPQWIAQNVDHSGRENSRPVHWHFGLTRRRVAPMILRVVGAASIFMGRTPHEVRGELSRTRVR